MTLKDLADLIVPKYLEISELEAKYPIRKQDVVTRFAPSPTGYLHTGSLYTAFINYLYAKNHQGVFYLRIEDTDQERLVDDAVNLLISSLKEFKIEYTNDETYAPYIQSKRRLVYDSVLHYLILNDLAYPCFCTKASLDELRLAQQKANILTGYYGKYAKCRSLSVDEAYQKIKNGEPYVVRFKSQKKHYVYHDLLRGDLNLMDNEFDIVIRKADLLPTYHFAHVCDDHFMRSTHVIRGEEWIASLPIHYALFEACGFEIPKYLHLPTIMKLDNLKKRKLSKRKDPEANVSNLLALGYPKKAILAYLLHLANSKYDGETDPFNYQLALNNFSLDGALFDLMKLNSIAKEYIATLDFDTLIAEILEYATKYDQELLKYIKGDEAYFKKIMAIGRGGANPRKDDEKYSDILMRVGFFYREYFDKLPEIKLDYDEEVVKKVLASFIKSLDILDEELWLQFLKTSSKEIGFAKNKKEKEALGLKYMFSDYMAIVRALLVKSNSSPNLFDVVRIMNKDEIFRRLLG